MLNEFLRGRLEASVRDEPGCEVQDLAQTVVGSQMKQFHLDRPNIIILQNDVNFWLERQGKLRPKEYANAERDSMALVE
jgi:hypothetical protein